MNQITKPLLIENLGMMFPRELSKRKERFGKYLCKCGNIFKSQIKSVKNGKTKSCGCYKKEMDTKHGLTTHPLYNRWVAMIQRCTNDKCSNYMRYGGVEEYLFVIDGKM